MKKGFVLWEKGKEGTRHRNAAARFTPLYNILSLPPLFKNQPDEQ